jgi:DNA-directed RNA polymerase subunit omega
MDIVSLPIEYDKDKIDSRFRMVSIASQRAKELALGAKPKLDTKHKKYATIAIEEAIESKLDFITGDEARAANEEARKFDYKRFLEERRRESMPEDISELERDLRVYLTEKEDRTTQALDALFKEPDETDEEPAEEE